MFEADTLLIVHTLLVTETILQMSRQGNLKRNCTAKKDTTMIPSISLPLEYWLYSVSEWLLKVYMCAIFGQIINRTSLHQAGSLEAQ